MTWCFEDETTPYSEGVLNTLKKVQAVVPSLWPFEVANVLLIGERRQRLTQAQTVRFVELLETLPINVTGASREFRPLLALGREYGLSAYDAAYLNLAASLGLPLATLDVSLRAAADRAGVALVEI